MNRRQFGQLVSCAALGRAFLRSGGQSLPPGTAHFQFSVMLWTLEKQIPTDRSIEIVKEAGYHGIELTHEFEQWSPEETRGIMTRMRSSGMVFDTIGGGKNRLADPSAGDALIAELTRRIAFAKELESPQIILTSGPRVEDLSPAAQRTAIIDNLKRAADLVSEHGIKLMLEPIDPLENRRAYLNSVADGFEIVKAVNSPNLRVLYDFYHEQRCCGNLIEKLENNIDWVGLVHIADVPGRHDPGTGEIDYGNIYRKLAELHYDKFIAMEFFPAGEPVQSLKKARMDAQKAAS